MTRSSDSGKCSPRDIEPRRQISGIAAISQAIEEDETVRLLLVRTEQTSPDLAPLVEQARRKGIPVIASKDRDVWRMAQSDPDAQVLALLGPSPVATEDELLGRGGAIWALVDLQYPTNIGYVIRTAEVSGASGVLVFGDYTNKDKGRAFRIAMGAERFLPVLWPETAAVQWLETARARGYRLVALENVDAKPPWEVPLAGDVIMIVGAERHGIPAEILDVCDDVVHVPMDGFVPSYNLQAPVAVLAAERLRQVQSES